MVRRIKRVAVLGSGVMGSGIAAHLAGLGLDTMLLDIAPKELNEEERNKKLTLEHATVRNRIARQGLERAVKQKPAAFYDPADAQAIRVGNFEDNMAWLKECDWIVEAVTERMEIKQSLFAKVDAHRASGSIVSSNTSGLNIAQMVAGRSTDFKQHFLVTHFFNPVRYMRLLELVPGTDTSSDVMTLMQRFSSDVLGKGVVIGKDTPNFVANRIGTFSMLYALRVMERDGFTVEEIDAVFGPASGRPKSAVFRTADLVGLDTLIHVANNCYDTLEKDESRDVFAVPQFLKEMVKRNWLGQKSGGGFYKKVGSDIQALDYKTFEYRPQVKVRGDSLGAAKGVEDIRQRVKTLVWADDKFGKLAWEVTAQTLLYTARHLQEIADDVVATDQAMRWGFNWDLGPFETWDAIDFPRSVERMRSEGMSIPPIIDMMLSKGHTSFYAGDKVRPTYYDVKKTNYAPVSLDPRQIRLAALEAQNRVIKRNSSATIFDMGDGVLLVSFHSKMNAVDADIVAQLHHAISLAEEDGYNGIVLGHEHPEVFSAGANLFAIMMGINQKAWGEIEKLIVAFQQATLRLRYSDIPVVAAPAGLALGGGAEMIMGCDAVRSHAELYMGLVEVGVGLIPAGGGLLSLIERVTAGVPDDAGFDTMPFLRRAFEAVAMAKVATGAEEARRFGFLRPTDGITANRDLLLNAAKEQVLGMARAGYRKPRPLQFRLPGPSGAATFSWFADNMRQSHLITDHEYKIAGKLATVLTGGDTSPRAYTSQQQILDLEREAFLSLCGEAKTQERIQHMLMHNKPLRN